ncbi:hypothetical protein LCGC14_2072120 [marine sediment metagenome]|uniref:DegT/DnrJ/EryC1/StrS aminotransferase family protein n=1 Tax=marine sediment metagenome TaxID=412755 RepID=A0A0F9GWG3_9ZZZZ
MVYNLNPYDINTAFESVVAQYCGSKYAISVDSCTNALLLCFSYSFRDVKKPVVTLPKRTYVGVAQAVLNAGGKIKWNDWGWEGFYDLYPYRIIDCARYFCKDMYKKIVALQPQLICLSFHWTKGLKIGKAGMILTDDKDAAYQLRKMRYDGRTERVHPRDDKFVRGFHCYLSPELAARGLLLMQNPKDVYPDTEPYTYGDLSLQEIFK